MLFMGIHLRAEPMHNMGESQSFRESKKMCLNFNQINFLVGHLLKGKTIQILVSVSTQFSSVQFSCSVVSNSLQPYGLQHNRPPCPSPTPRACSNSCPSSQWYHPTISSSVIPFSSCPQSLPASESFPMSQLFA